jgi:putative lipoprotein
MDRRFGISNSHRARAQPAGASSSAEQSLKKFLRDYVKEKDRRFYDDKTARYFDALVDLNGDGKKEAIVYLVGRTWCGSGGCPTLVLVRNSAGWKLLQYITITRPPIRVLSSTSRGWHDISVWVQGGGIQPGYEAELSFDGKTYSGNPSVPPARRLKGNVPGEIVISSMEGGTPLYP